MEGDLVCLDCGRATPVRDIDTYPVDCGGCGRPMPMYWALRQSGKVD